MAAVVIIRSEHGSFSSSFKSLAKIQKTQIIWLNRLNAKEKFC